MRKPALLGLFGSLLLAFGGAAAGAGVPRPAAVAPVASLGASPNPVLAGDQVLLDARGSTDSSGEIRDYAWDLGNGSFSLDSGLVPTVRTQFNAEGSHAVRVRVTNDAGQSDIATLTVDVRPLPPLGPVGVTIDADVYATSSPSVALRIVWPLYAASALLSNDSRFGSGAQTRGLKPTIDWRLSSGNGTKTLRVRFPGSGNPDKTYTDEIVLDTGAPAVQTAAYTGRNGAAAQILVKATEAVSGISQLEFSTSRSGGKTVTLSGPKSQGATKLARIIEVKIAARPTWMRARSVAGNWSPWHAIS
jgi:PKD repeat protein